MSESECLNEAMFHASEGYSVATYGNAKMFDEDCVCDDEAE